MDDLADKKKMAAGRQTSVLEGFIQTIGINMGGVYVPNFILTAFLLEMMHASNALIGLATSAQFFVGLFQPLANVFVHKVKHRSLVTGISGAVSRLLFVGAIFYGMLASGPGAEAVFMVILLVGAFSMSISSSTWSVWMADLVPDQIRGRYFALRNSVASVAGIFAVLVGGWLLKTFPGAPGFTVVYTIAGLTAVVGTLLVFTQYNPPVVDQPTGSVWSQYRGIFKDRNFMAFVRMVLFFNLALVVASPFFTVHFIEVFQVPLDILGYFTAAAAVTAILGNLFFGKMSDILGNRFIIRFSLLLMIIPTVLMLFVPAQNPLPLVAAIILMQSFFMAGWNLATFNTSLSISPRGQRALYIGVYNSMNSLSAVFAPVLGGFLIDVVKVHHPRLPMVDWAFPPTTVVFALSALLLFLGLLTFPFYREANRNEDYSLRDVVFRMNFPEILYKLFVSTFMPRISSRHRLTEDIADLRSPAAVVPLGRLLRDLDPEVRMSALEGLGKTGADEAVRALLDYYPQAGVLEKIEILRSFKTFAKVPEVKEILLEEAKAPYLVRRLRALRSLGPVASDPEVVALVATRLREARDSGAAGWEEEDYLAWVELAVGARDPGVFDQTLPLYPRLSDPLGRRGLLFQWSTLLGFRDDFYRFVAYDHPDDRASFLDEARVASVETVVKSKALVALRPTLKREAKAWGTDAPGFFLAHEAPVFQALSAREPSLHAVLRTFLHQPTRSEDEEAFLLLALKTLVGGGEIPYQGEGSSDP